MKNGLFVIISSPGGGGKDSVIAELIKKIPNSTRLITTTSRPATRPGDVPEVTYHFISRADFEKKINEGYFLEYNNCAGNLYGTHRETLEKALQTYDVVFSNIDVNGKFSMDQKGITNLSFFILPENMEVLRKRAEKRGGMTEKMIEDRLKLGEKEIETSVDYDYRIVNKEGKLAETVAEVEKIIKKSLENRNS